jgi:protein O-GlcNAc transferase
MSIAANPGCAEAHNNLGVLYREAGNMDRAVRCYESALRCRPGFPQGLSNLAVVLTQQGRAQEALGMLRAALAAAPDYAEAHNNLGVLQRDVGDMHAAVSSYERCLQLDPDNRSGGQNRLLALNYLRPGEEAEVCMAHLEWGRRFQQLHQRLPAPKGLPERAPGELLIVGYISPDLHTHSVSYFAEAPLTHHRRERVKMVIFSCCSRPDAKTKRLRAATEAAGGVWHDVGSLGEAELAAMVREERVNILVDLTGHTANNRLGTFAMRPAPVQVTWIGYPNSTGLAAVDFRITDAACDPHDTRQTFSEVLFRLPGCFLCYTPAVDAPTVAPLPALDSGFVTFGSFNALAKQTPEVLRLWGRVLCSVPGSRLVLKNKPFACRATRRHWWRLLENAGVERDRVDLLPLAPATSDHLAQYSMVDIALDPFPYAGTTTTAEALYMGVPVLTLAGNCHAHNVGASLLDAVDLAGEWVAMTEDEYVAIARRAASDVPALAELRAGLRQKMLASPLCDGPAFVAGLEDAYEEMWRIKLASGVGGVGGDEGSGAATDNKG